MDTVGYRTISEEVTTVEEEFRAMIFLLREMNLDMENYFKI